ncbi:hypothetical protein [Capnocytophaga canis]|uniref:hypothetical protein n=1 Tax=Capnocytophaga canis TaxID=1848903 RepID=UPI0011C23B19|nr:hypothetical protein [Capnocytophaga canis]
MCSKIADNQAIKIANIQYITFLAISVCIYYILLLLEKRLTYLDCVLFLINKIDEIQNKKNAPKTYKYESNNTTIIHSLKLYVLHDETLSVKIL